MRDESSHQSGLDRADPRGRRGELVAGGTVSRGRAQDFRDDLVARDLAGTFLATMIGYIATGPKS